MFMKHGCPNIDCKYHKKIKHIIKYGSYFRKNDSRVVKRFRCSYCGKRFSNATFSLAKYQKKRRVNKQIQILLASSVSMRRISKILHIHRTTVKRKLIYLAEKAEVSQERFLKSLRKNRVHQMQFDDLITSEHTKLKPLSITMAVDEKTRQILGASVSQIPAFGKLAKYSVKKYGYRKSFHRKGIEDLFIKIKKSISPQAIISSDEHNIYPEYVKKHFPYALHKRYKSEKGCVVGQGELKKVRFDPLFSINHTFAMLRANINRLVRRTWCTTKDPTMLKAHLMIYINSHNQNLSRK